MLQLFVLADTHFKCFLETDVTNTSQCLKIRIMKKKHFFKMYTNIFLNSSLEFTQNVALLGGAYELSLQKANVILV